MKTNSINLEDIRHFWEQSGGEVMGGHFNETLYLRFLQYYNNR